MEKHLTDSQKKKIIADYTECENYSQVARKYKVSFDTVKRTVLNDPETVKKTEQKKDQNTADILAHMETQKIQVCGLLDKYLEALGNEEKINRSNVLQLATTMGIIIDKYTATVRNEQALKKLDEMLDKIGGVI